MNRFHTLFCIFIFGVERVNAGVAWRCRRTPPYFSRSIVLGSIFEFWKLPVWCYINDSFCNVVVILALFYVKQKLTVHMQHDFKTIRISSEFLNLQKILNNILLSVSSQERTVYCKKLSKKLKNWEGKIIHWKRKLRRWRSYLKNVGIFEI